MTINGLRLGRHGENAKHREKYQSRRRRSRRTPRQEEQWAQGEQSEWPSTNPSPFLHTLLRERNAASIAFSVTRASPHHPASAHNPLRRSRLGFISHSCHY